VHGLTETKQISFVQLLKDRYFDIIALMETWHPNHRCINDSPYLHSLSSQTQHPKAPSCTSGGVAIYIRPEDHQKYTSIPAINSISLLRNGYCLTFAYFSPSLQSMELELILDSLPKSELLMADFNTDFSNRSDRSRQFKRYLDSQNMHYIVPSNGTLKLDHCFSHPSLSTTCEIHDQYYLAIQTDHSALTARIIISGVPETGSTARRYNYSTLRHRNTRSGCSDFLRIKYRELSPQISKDLSAMGKAAEDIHLISSDQQEDMRGALANSAVYCVEDALTAILDEYFLETHSRPKSRNVRQPRLLDTTDEIILHYQRLMRNQSTLTTVIKPTTPGVTAEEDCARVWENIWNKEPDHIAPAELPSFDLSEPLGEVKVKVVRKLIRSYPSNKASGENGIHIILLKALLSGPFAHHLTTVYNLLLTLQVTPAHWNHAIVCMLPKDNSGFADKCRPISLTNVLRRIFEKLLHPLLLSATEKQIHPCEAGFTPNDSTLRPLQTTDRSIRPFRVLMDLMFAFDSPFHHILAEMLKEMNVPLGLSRCIHFLFFCSLTSKMIANGRKSRLFTRSRGLFQGTILSPTLFNIYINRILKRFIAKFGRHMAHLLVVILAYADDMKIFARCYDEACQMVRFLDYECSKIGLTIRPKKCTILSSEFCTISIPGYDEDIGFKTIDKYLGAECDSNGIHWRAYYKRVLLSHNKALNWLTLLTRSWPSGARVTAYQVFVRPKLEYCAALFALTSLDLSCIEPQIIAYKDVWDDLEAVYKDATCRLLGQKTFNKAHYSILGWPTLPQRFLQLITQISLSKHKLDIPFIALANHYIKNRKMIGDETFETFKQFNLRELTQHYNETYTGRRDAVPIPRQNNGRDMILHWKYSPSAQRHLIYWRKGIFALNRRCICGGRFTLSHSETCFGTHLTIEEQIRQDEFKNVEEYLEIMWKTMNSNSPLN
jgi:hypothetical protein